MSFDIKQPVTKKEFKNYYHLRWELLRAPWNQPEGSEIDEIESQCFHLMAVAVENKIIGVARLQFNSPAEAQIRYMAVTKESQGLGIGHGLITALEQRARLSGHAKIILDAREPAVGFYQKFGYDVIDTSYLLFDEIQHFRMEKKIRL